MLNAARFVLIAFAALSQTAQELDLLQESESFRVHVKVSAEADLQDGVTRCLTKELESLPKVTLTDASPDFVISIIALEVATPARRQVGTAYSVLITEPAAEAARRLATPYMSAETQAELSALLEGTVKPLAHWVETTPAKQIQQVCRSVMDGFVRQALVPRQRR